MIPYWFKAFHVRSQKRSKDCLYGSIQVSATLIRFSLPNHSDIFLLGSSLGWLKVPYLSIIACFRCCRLMICSLYSFGFCLFHCLPPCFAGWAFFARQEARRMLRDACSISPCVLTPYGHSYRRQYPNKPHSKKTSFGWRIERRSCNWTKHFIFTSLSEDLEIISWSCFHDLLLIIKFRIAPVVTTHRLLDTTAVCWNHR